MDYGRGPWELVMVRTTRQMPLKLCSDYSLPIWRRTWDHKKRVCPPFAFFHYATFFLVLEFLYFLKINSRQRVHYQPANRLSVLVEMGFKVARRRRGKKWNGFLSLHPPPLTSLPTQFFSLLIFFFPTPLWSLIPCQANTIFRRHERIYAKHCWLVVLVHVKLTLSACFNSCHLPTTFRHFKWRLTAFIMYVIWW